jgi:hypothetical protein
MLVLTEEAYAQVTKSSPNRNADEGIIPGARVVDLSGGGAVPSGRATGLPIDILPLAKLILHRSSVRKVVLASG